MYDVFFPPLFFSSSFLFVDSILLLLLFLANFYPMHKDVCSTVSSLSFMNMNISLYCFYIFSYLASLSSRDVVSHCVPQDIVSEHPERFFVSEIVREKIFMQYRSEVPYACQVYEIFVLHSSYPFPIHLITIWFNLDMVHFFKVNVVSYKTRPTAKDFIQVEVIVEKNSQKIILIGKVCFVFFDD